MQVIYDRELVPLVGKSVHMHVRFLTYQVVEKDLTAGEWACRMLF
jgi:hypothetical protein